MEKRKFSRVPFRIQAEITAGEESFTGEVENMSLKGMYVRTEHVVDIGTPLTISIILTDNQSNLVLNLKGRTVRRTGEGIGIYFDKMDLDSFIHLKNIIEYNSTDSDKTMNEFLQYFRDAAPNKEGGNL